MQQHTIENAENQSTSSSSNTQEREHPPQPPPPPPPPSQSTSTSFSSPNSTSTPLTTLTSAIASTDSTSISISLKLCLYGGKEATVERCYDSKTTTVEELEKDMRKLFNIDADRQTKLWINNNKDLTPKQTLTDIGINEGTIVTIEVINADGTWPSSRPRYGQISTRSSKSQPGLCGLSNMGNTCFMNSALQCLSNTPPLTEYILTDKFVDDINTNNPLGMHGEIARTYAELIKIMWSGNNSSFMPREFKASLNRFAPQFSGFSQQDCQELMAFLLDGLHEDLNRIREKPYIEMKNEIERRPDEVLAEESWSNYKKRNDSIVVDLFHGLLKSTLVCPGCKLVSVTFDPFCYLSLPLPVKREKSVMLTFIPAPNKVDVTKLNSNVIQNLSPEEIKTIKQYGGSISSLNGFIEDCGGYTNPTNRPRSCRIQVPRSGPVGEICDIVARILNEELDSNVEKVKPHNLVVAELSIDCKIVKVYESNEHYNQLSDDIVVVEKANKYMIPLYLREYKSGSSGAVVVVGKPLFLHVPDLHYDTLYKSTLASLSNLSGYKNDLEDESEEDHINNVSWHKICDPVDVPIDESADNMDCENENHSSSNQVTNMDAESSGDVGTTNASTDSDEQMIESTNGNGIDSSGSYDEIVAHITNGTSHSKQGDGLTKKPGTGNAFKLCSANSFGTLTIVELDTSKKECEYSSKLYLGANFTSTTAFSYQFKHIHETNRFEPSTGTFTPKVPPKPTLQLKDCITQFANVERLGADDPWYCPKCKKHQQATKKFDIWSLPKVLIIHLKRFSFSRSWRDKIDTLVEFPVDNLDMSKYVLDPSQKKKSKLIYNLIGVANHFGGLGGGHYNAYAKNAPTNTWYTFDDASVTQTSSNNVVTRSAYVLFYQLQEDD